MKPDSAHTGSISVWAVFYIKKRIKLVTFCFLLTAFVWAGANITDNDSVEVEWWMISIMNQTDNKKLRQNLMQIASLDEAGNYLSACVPKILDVVSMALKQTYKENGRMILLPERMVSCWKDIVHRATNSVESETYVEPGK